MIARVLLRGETACEVALSLGISKSWLSGRLAAILDRLRRNVADSEETHA